MLSEDEQKMIKKDFPYRHLRDKKIHEIFQKGISCYLLAELTGLGKSSILRIAGDSSRSVRILINHKQNQIDNLNKINDALDAFYKEIKKILHGRK